MSQILDQSGLKAPTLYHHFGGKERLYVTWVGQALGTARHDLCSTLRSYGPINDKLIAYANTLLGQPFDLLQILRDRQILTEPDAYDKVQESVSSCLIVPLAEAMDSNFKVDNPAVSANLFLLMVASCKKPYSIKDGSLPPVAHTVDVFLDGIEN